MKKSWRHWLETPWAMLTITGVLFGLVALFVDLKPVVNEGFFFSSSDPQFRQSKKIEKRFPAPRKILLNVASNDISSYSDVIIAAGFAIFALSSFPPTQRFGLVVLAGTIVDILANLFVLPLLGGAQWKTKLTKRA